MSTVDAKRANSRSMALDVLRILAALWVVAYHWSPFLNVPSWFGVFANFGYLGVDVFFVLSGAVIIHSALNRPWSDFARARFLRLFPALFVVTAVLLVGTVATSPETLDARDLVQPIGLGSWLGLRPTVDVAWTLYFEVLFYMLVAVLIMKAKRLNARTAQNAISAFLVASLIARVINEPVTNVLTLQPYGPLFAFGAVLGLATAADSLRPYLPAAILAAALSADTLVARAGERTTSEGSRALWAVGIIAFATVFILWSRLARKSGPRYLRLARVVTTLSLMTYPLYLLHKDYGVRVIGRGFEAGLAPLAAATVALAAILLASFVSVRFFEPWARGRLRSLFGWDDRKPPNEPTTVSRERQSDSGRETPAASESLTSDGA